MDNVYRFNEDFRATLRKRFEKVFDVVKADKLFEDFMMIGILPVDTAEIDSKESVILDYFDLSLRNRREKAHLSIENVSSNVRQLFSWYLRRIKNYAFSNRFYMIGHGDSGVPIVQTVHKQTGVIETKTEGSLKADLINSNTYSDAELGNMIRYQLAELTPQEVSVYCPITTFDSNATLDENSNDILYTIVCVVKCTIMEKGIAQLISAISQLEYYYSPVTLPIFRKALLVKNYKFRLASAKSAIGSIMSRNGSHNIGSHVLAALSHNVGTMPDDQMLYQYIQHRMDYIATATTDRPTWTQPTMFVGEIMRRFLSQRHLLNYISKSEGLKAWEFQSDKALVEGVGGHIRFHVRKVDGAGTVDCDFVKYDSPDDPIDWGKDVSLAVPGGIVGQHAFFTIVENIVRNAAKHDWVTPPSKTQGLKSKNRDVENPDGNLDIYIDFEDNPELDFVKFTIWTRLSDVMDGKDGKYSSKYDTCLKVAQPKQWKECLNTKDIKHLPLHWHQEVELSRPFISEDGSLRRENWGLAEMKISAGYLQKSKIEDIGGLGNGGHNIIVPCSVPDTRVSDANSAKCRDVHHLGYRFDVPKSKLILFVVDKMPEGWTSQLELELRRKGIYLLQESEIDGKKELCYQYIVLDEFNGDKLSWMLPFRIIAAQKRDPSVTDKVPLFFDGANTSRRYLGRVISESKKQNDKIDIGKVCDTIKEDICSCWVRHLIAERRKQGQFGNQPSKATESTLIGDKPISLVVYPLGGNGGAGETLVTDIDIVEYAFNEGLVGALHGFKKTGRNADLASKFVDCLLDLIKIKIVEVHDGKRTERVVNKLVFNRKREQEYAKRANIKHDFSCKGIIKRQLSEWLKDWRNNGNYSNDVNAAINFLEDAFDDVAQIDDKIVSLEAQRDEFAVLSANWIQFDDDIAEQRKLKSKVQKAKVNPISALVDYLNSYCDQVKGLISKYAEKIATLPNGFSVDGSRQSIHGGGAAGQSDRKVKVRQVYDQGWLTAGIVAFNEEILQQGECKEKPTVDTFVLRYWRHQTQKKKADLYLEGLSGTQSYLNTLEKIGKTNYALVARLVENALLRIMIVDERTREFLEQHVSLKSTYINMGIFVANDKKVSVELDLLEKGGVVKEPNCLMADGFVNLSANKIDKVRKNYPGENNKAAAREIARQEAKEKYHEQFEILIIHQGIIDKWLPGASHDKARVENFVDSLKQVFKYVVITTGRGSPANVPNSARVLPFSTIQTTLFKQYPEKMILTDAIMNILPMKGHGNGQ